MVGTKRSEPVRLKRRPNEQPGKRSQNSRSFVVNQSKYNPFNEINNQYNKQIADKLISGSNSNDGPSFNPFKATSSKLGESDYGENDNILSSNYQRISKSFTLTNNQGPLNSSPPPRPSINSNNNNNTFLNNFATSTQAA
jgi:hypothetical protein